MPDTLAMLNLSPDEVCHKAIETAKYFEKKIRDIAIPGQLLGNTESMQSGHLRTLVYPSENPLVLHELMFVPTLQNQASDEQQARWMPLVKAQKMFGTYAQTELGHGTNMRGLETTATYDPATEEFILHSPTLSSIKCWPNGLGRFACYAIVMAQLYTKGQCHGLHPFMVHLRNIHDHTPLPGITLGDVGPKMGLSTTDNGFLRFQHVRIPRENMLMRHAQVLKDGTYVRPAVKRANYGALILMRVAVVNYVMYYLAQACTIAVRFSAVRRQGCIEEGKPEVKIMDYQTQQYRLFPQVALAYGMIFTFQKLRIFYAELFCEFNNEKLVETHALTSGLKALSSQTCAAGAEICRQACGGLGYLQASRLPLIYSAAVAACTYEGDNVVLYLQTARYLIKSYKMVQAGKPVPNTVKYLMVKRQPSVNPTCLEEFLILYENSAASLTKAAANLLAADHERGKKAEIAWNDNALSLVRCAVIHTQVYVIQCLNDFLLEITVSDPLKKTLNYLFELLAIYWLLQNAGEFITHGGCPPQKIDEFHARIPFLLRELRPNIVTLVDGFDFCDAVLHSIIGNYDGRVYERICDYWATLPANKNQKNPHLRGLEQPKSNL